MDRFPRVLDSGIYENVNDREESAQIPSESFFGLGLCHYAASPTYRDLFNGYPKLYFTTNFADKWIFAI